MFDANSLRLQYSLGGIRSNNPAGLITLRKFIDSHSNPKKSVVSLISKIREASSIGDDSRKAQLKESLPFITPSIIVRDYRRYVDIKEFTGLAQLDFDGIDNAVDLRAHIFENYTSVVCAYVSPSQRGVKALIRIPIVDTVEQYKEYYAAIIEEFDGFDGFDSAPKNAVLPLFFSYDYFLLSRDIPTIWDKKIKLETPTHIDRPIPQRPYKKNANNYDKTIRIFESKIREINSATGGHPRVRSAALVLGTRVGYGYLPYYDAISLAEREIKTNQYLSKGTAGYIKTAVWGIETGIKTPKGY